MFCSKIVHQNSCFLMCRLSKTNIFTRAGLAWAPNLPVFFNLFWLRQFQKLDFSKLSQQKQCPEGFRLSKLPWGTLGAPGLCVARTGTCVTRTGNSLFAFKTLPPGRPGTGLSAGRPGPLVGRRPPATPEATHAQSNDSDVKH